jgi:precorrin-8X/cobalt-precorrin-8 methylmutase
VEAGLRAIRAGEAIVVDVRMVQVGIDGPRVRDFGIQVHCRIHDPEVQEEAKRLGTTRARIAMRKAVGGLRGGIVAIGNAPTALFEILALIAAREASPALVIGVPVGFVGAQESKDLLLASSIPCITLPGTRGGSPIAVSLVNALLRLAKGVV